MGYYALTYEVVDDYIDRRATFRQDHLQLASAAHDRGELVMGGAFADPPDKVLIVFQGKDSRGAESFARNDPYVLNGLVKRWEVRAWTVVVGGEPKAAPSSSRQP